MGGIFGGKNQKTTTQVNLPSYVTDAYQQALSSAQNAASTPYQPYTGQQVAPLNPVQDAAMAGIAGTVGAANPYLQQATNMIGNINPVSPTQFSSAALQQYESPYTQDVINATQKQFNLSNAQQQQGLVGNAASNHALGGDRVAVAQAQLAGQQDTAQAATIAGLNNQNYQQAQNEFNTQQQTGMAAQEANNYTNLYGAGEMGNLGQLALGTGLQGYGALLGAGTLGQQTQQAQDTAGYQNYLTAQQYPFQTAQYLSNIAGNLGSVYGGNKTTTTPGPSLAGQLLGAGTSLYGAGAFGGLGGAAGDISGALASQGAFDSVASLVPDMAGLAAMFAKGGSVGKFADGGSDDDEEDDYSPTENFAESDDDNTGGAEDLSGAENALAGIAAGPPAPMPSQGIAPASGGMPSAQQPSGDANGLGLDPLHMALLQAGFKMMSTPGNLGQQIGAGGSAGLAAYQQQKNIEAQQDYRRSMSGAATTRAEALAKHYENADTKPVLIHGKTFQWYYPSTGETVDTHLDNPSYLTGQGNVDARNVANAIRKQELNRPDMMIVGSDNSDPAHPKVMMADRHNPSNIITTDAAPKGGVAGAAGGVFGFKYQAAKASGMSDADALQFAGGHKQLGQQDIDKYAMQQATASANALKDSFDTPEAYDTYRKQQFDANRSLLAAGVPAAAPVVPNAPANVPGPAPIKPVPMTVPPAYTTKPDGFRLQKGNTFYTKKGNMLIPDAAQ